MRKHRIAILFFVTILTVALAGCNSTDIKLLPENIAQVDVTYSVYSNTTEKRTLDSAGISDWTAWVEELSLKHETFDDGETPGAVYAGGESYLFDINNGELTFSYIDFGTKAYIYYGDEWYKVSKPKSPFSAPGSSKQSRPIAAVIQDDVTIVNIEHIRCGQITKSTVEGISLNELRAWADGLEYEHKTFAKGNTPGDADGGEVYSFEIMESDYPGFSYYIGGPDNCYLLIEGEWYKVSNPSDPPITK